MKIRHLCLALVAVALISVMASPVLAHWKKPGMSPGWWKHQFNAHFEGKGKPHLSWGLLYNLTIMINWYYGEDPPYFFGYNLPPVSSLDYNGDGIFEMEDAYNIFNDRDWNHMWTPLANWYNWASGRGPYW